MKPPPFQYEKATSVDGLLAALESHGGNARILAGGQSLVPLMNFRLASPDVLIDINGLAELDYVRVNGDTLSIGALTRHKTLRDSEAVARHCPLMAEAYTHVAHGPVRNRGTIGGNLSHADPASEMPAVAVCLEATLVAKSQGGERSIPATDFFRGALETALEPNEVLAEIQIPVSSDGEGWSFQEVSPRKGDFAIAAVGATLRFADGVCEAARIAHAGIEDRAAKAVAAEQLLVGQPASDDLFDKAAEAAADAVDPTVVNFHGDAAYKRDLVRALTRRTLRQAHARSGA